MSAGGEMDDGKCESCGKKVSGFDGVSLGRDGEYSVLCCACFNGWAAERMGVDFEHPEFDAVALRDSRGVSHLFHLRTSLVATGLLIEAIEDTDGRTAGYQFAVLGQHEDDPLKLFGRLYEKIRRRLAQQHLEEEDDGPQIGKDWIVRGMITWGEKSDRGRRLPGLVIDGRSVTWEEFGSMLASFEGFQFKLEIRDRTDEMG